MIRRLYVTIIMMAVVLSFGCTSYAAAKKEKEKFTGSLLTSCTLYQLGSSEFVITLHGRKLPVPVPEFSDESMSIILENARAVKPEVMNLSALNYIEATPLLYSFEIENLSYDRVAITMKANAELELSSSTRTADGFNLRIKALKEPDQQTASLPAIASPPKPSVIYPETKLPFSIDTRITVELRDAELRDVLRLMMAQIGRNIIIDTSFPADVLITMSLFDVRIDEVLNHLMRTYDIACYDSGANTTTFGTREGLYKLSGGRTIKTFNISYADMAQVVAMLRNLAAVPEGELVTDERTHTLYVNTNPAKMVEVEDLISKIDVPAKQVMIRASIFEFNDSVTREVESAIAMAYDEWNINIGSGIGLNYQEDRTLTGRSPRTARTMEATFSALEAKNKGRVLANPSVIAIDGQAATIELTQTYTYSVVRDDAGNAISQQEDVGPTLTFTPRIERDGYIYLQLSLSTGDVVGYLSGTPITSDRNVTTNVRVKDGTPFVVGGLFQDNKNDSVSKIPIVGDIPLLGELFTYRTKTNQRTQAVMVVTPYIID